MRGEGGDAGVDIFRPLELWRVTEPSLVLLFFRTLLSGIGGRERWERSTEGGAPCGAPMLPVEVVARGFLCGVVEEDGKVESLGKDDGGTIDDDEDEVKGRDEDDEGEVEEDAGGGRGGGKKEDVGGEETGLGISVTRFFSAGNG